VETVPLPAADEVTYPESFAHWEIDVVVKLAAPSPVEVAIQFESFVHKERLGEAKFATTSPVEVVITPPKFVLAVEVLVSSERLFVESKSPPPAIVEHAQPVAAPDDAWEYCPSEHAEKTPNPPPVLIIISPLFPSVLSVWESPNTNSEF